MLNSAALKSLLKRLLNTLAFINLPIAKKFLFFSTGTLFWLVATSAISFVMIFSLGAEVTKLVDVITPQQKVLSSCVRKLRGAGISLHQIAIAENNKEMNEQFHRAKTRLDDCLSSMSTLRTGGLIKDYSRESDELYDEYAVARINNPENMNTIEHAVQSIRELSNLLSEFTNSRGENAFLSAALRNRLSAYDMLTKNTVADINKLSIALSTEWGTVSDIVRKKFRAAFLLITLVFLLGASLSIIFGLLISRNIVIPIEAIISSFKAFSSKDLTVARKLEVTSKDEIGELAEEYNRLLDAIKVVTSFKKIIEEDESVNDIYIHLGNILTEELGFHGCEIYEISMRDSSVTATYPPGADILQLHCGVDILSNGDFCRANRTGHMVESMEYRGICKLFHEKESDEVHFCIPIVLAGKVAGVVQITTNSSDADSPDFAKRLRTAQEYITEAQPVLAAKRTMRAFKELSLRDGLTGMYNRRFLEETAESLTAGVRRRASSVGLLMCDLDFFKEINDKNGHAVGDAVLRETAALIKNCIRNSDLLVRFGGEEFLVVLMDMASDVALEIAEKIRTAVERQKISIPGGELQKTISIGISIFPKDSQDFWEAVKFADVALYRAKNRGRNRVVVFMPDLRMEDGYEASHR
jgi:two-component system cell cycle response regulator